MKDKNKSFISTVVNDNNFALTNILTQIAKNIRLLGNDVSKKNIFEIIGDADGATTEFNLSAIPNSKVIVFVDGVAENINNYNINGSKIVFNVAPASGTIMANYWS